MSTLRFGGLLGWQKTFYSNRFGRGVQGEFLNLVGLTFDKDTLNQSHSCNTLRNSTKTRSFK